MWLSNFLPPVTETALNESIPTITFVIWGLLSPQGPAALSSDRPGNPLLTFFLKHTV